MYVRPGASTRQKRCWRRRSPDLLITDLRLGQYNGLHLVLRTRSDLPGDGGPGHQPGRRPRARGRSPPAARPLHLVAADCPAAASSGRLVARPRNQPPPPTRAINPSNRRFRRNSARITSSPHNPNGYIGSFRAFRGGSRVALADATIDEFDAVSHGLVADLHAPRPWIFWTDLVASAAMGWSAFAFAVQARPLLRSDVDLGAGLRPCALSRGLLYARARAPAAPRDARIRDRLEPPLRRAAPAAVVHLSRRASEPSQPFELWDEGRPRVPALRQLAAADVAFRDSIDAADADGALRPVSAARAGWSRLARAASLARSACLLVRDESGVSPSGEPGHGRQDAPLGAGDARVLGCGVRG